MSNDHTLQLAQEIIDEILDIVVAASKHPRPASSLKACALVCKAFLPRCQMHIFSTIHFRSCRRDRGARVRRMKEFLSILQGTPYIAKFIRNLDLEIVSWDNDWIADDQDFLQVMARLMDSGNPGLQVLRLSGSDSFLPQRFTTAADRLELNFMRPYISPFITSLRISSLTTIPPAVISSCVNLKDLAVLNTDLATLDEEFRADENDIQSYPKIEMLEFDRPGGTMNIILNTKDDTSVIVNLSCLRVLKSTINLNNVPRVQKITKISGKSLEEVYLSFSAEYDEYWYDEHDEVAYPFNLGHNPCLRILSVALTLGLPAGDLNGHPFSNLCTIIKSIPLNNTFEKLHLGVSVDPSDMRCSEDWELLDSGMMRAVIPALDNALGSRSKINESMEQLLAGAVEFEKGQRIRLGLTYQVMY